MDNLMQKHILSEYSTHGSVTVYGIGENRTIRLVQSKCRKKIKKEDIYIDPKEEKEKEENIKRIQSLSDGFKAMYADSDKTFAYKDTTEKADCNVTRARSELVRLALCNNWDWFCTFTIDPSKYDRYNLSGFYHDFNQWLRNQQRIHGYKIKYLFVPEQHSDGAWHLHGLMSGLPVSELRQFKVGDTMGSGIAEKVLKGQTVYNWPVYAKKFGFCDIDPVKSSEACSKYISKYITKDTTRMVQEYGAHIYYCSKGLNRPEKVIEGTISYDIAPIQDTKAYYFENDYCKVVQIPYSDDMLSAVLALFTARE